MTDKAQNKKARERGSPSDVPIQEVLGALAGKTRADNWKHALARFALLDLLTSDHRVKNVWKKWGQMSGMTEAAVAVAKALDRLAVAAGFETRGDVADIWLTENREPDQRGLLQLADSLNCDHSKHEGFVCNEFAGVSRAFGMFAESYANLGNEQMLLDADDFVKRHLGLPWPWLSLELLGHYRIEGLAFALGRTISFQGWVDDPVIQAPSLNVAFETHTKAGESVESAIERLTEQFARGLSRLNDHAQQRQILRGRFPGDSGIERIRRNVSWFYDVRLCGVKTTRLAREYHAEVHADFPKDHDDRKQVRDGIDEAIRLLELAVYKSESIGS